MKIQGPNRAPLFIPLLMLQLGELFFRGRIEMGDFTRDLLEEKTILYYNGKDLQESKQEVIHEVPLTVFFNGEEVVTLLCSPMDQKALAVGFLRSEGLIKGEEELMGVHFEGEKGIVYVEAKGEGDWNLLLQKKRTITSGCGGGTTLYRASDLLQLKKIRTETRIKPLWVSLLLQELQRRSHLYRRTRGIHSSAFSQGEEIVLYAEDIGRHNAVDKLIGKNLLGTQLPVHALISSGRISSEILLKAARVSIPIVISRAAPTSLSVKLAEELGITMIAFVKGQSFKVFSYPERVS